jgi:hypothetical protein
MRRLTLISVVLTMLAGWVSAGEPRVLFEDNFDGKLAVGWHWLRENPNTWRFKDGALEICVEPGKASTVKNALVRIAPDEATTSNVLAAGPSKIAIEVTVTFTSEPTQQFEQAGITWYHEKKPLMKLVHERIDGKDWIIPGRKPAPCKTVQLRLVVEKLKWTAQYRENAEGEFQTAGSGKLPPSSNDEVSIQCYNGPSDAEHWIRFDDFRILKLQ